MGAANILAQRDAAYRERLREIGSAIGYGNAQQILGVLWDEMLGASGRGRMGVTVEPIKEAERDVFAERRRQVDAEGWSPEHDDEHGDGSLARAAATYAFPDIWNVLGSYAWPWNGGPNFKSPRENLVRAGALILAEIERLDRAAGQWVECEDCDGTGSVGEPGYMGDFQPPERAQCDSCEGSGRWMVAASTKGGAA